MNPFSAFLVPRNNQAIDVSPVNEALNQMRGRAQDRQHVLENSQRQALAEKDDARSNAYLQLQQAQQQRKFSTEDQKQVEDLLAEYHDALDTGDTERVNRATAMLKRFGMDVQSGTAPGSTPDLKAFTGQSLLPSVKPDLQALTGKSPNPIDDAVQTELKSREALKAKNSAPEQDLSQDDFEQQLINGDQTPSRYEEGGQTTPEFKAMLPQDEPEDLGDVDDPKFKADAASESETTTLSPQQEAQFQAWAKQNGIRDANDPNAHYDYRGFFLQTNGAPHPPGSKMHFPDTFKQHGHETFSVESKYSKGPQDGGSWNGDTYIPQGGVIDLDAEDATPLQIGQQTQEKVTQAPSRLPGQLLPTIISKGGKVLEQSNGAAGRYAPMVAGVFEPFAQHENPEFAAAGKRAQALATKLVSVDGISPKQAIELAAHQMQSEMTGLNNLERTKIGSRPRFGGTGGTGLMGKTQDIAESAQLYDDNARAEAAKIQEEDRQYESIEAAATSGDPALQRDAVNQLLKIRSGTAVTAAEDARISQINGLLAQVQDRLGRWSGGAMTPEMARTIQQIVSLKRQVSQAKIKRIYEHQAKLYEAQNRGKTKDPAVLQERANVLREGANVVGADPNENLYK